MLPAAVRRLVLVRHAKSKYPYGVPDHERPLAGRGLRNAQAAAQWFTDEGPRPDVLISSDAVRALQTAEVICSGLSPRPTRQVDKRLYAASTADVLAVARGAPAAATTLVLVGHEPSMSDTVLLLAGPGSQPQALDWIKTKFPTNGIAVLAVRSTWRSLQPRGAVLERFEVPRA